MLPGPSESDRDNVVDQDVFAVRRIADAGAEGLLARASAAERAVVSLESRLQEIERELNATASQRDSLAAELRAREVSLRESQASPLAADRNAAGPRSQDEIHALSTRLVRADDRVAELQTDLARARGDVLEAEQQLAVERARVDVTRRGDSEREARLREAEAEIASRLEAVRVAEVEAHALRETLEAQRTRLGARLREVDAALVELGGRLREEQAARRRAEQALATEQSIRETQLILITEELERRTARVDDVQAQLGELRGELVRVLESGVVADDHGASETRIAEIEGGLREVARRAKRFERERDELSAALIESNNQLTERNGELSRLRAEAASSDEQLTLLRKDLEGAWTALELAREAKAAEQATAQQERLARLRVEADLENERKAFARQIEEADRRLRTEIERHREAFDDHAGSVERAIAALNEQLVTARGAMEEELAQEIARREQAEREAHQARAALEATQPATSPATPQAGDLHAGLAAAAARLRELAAIRGPLPAPELDDVSEAPVGSESAVEAEPRDHAAELARVIAEPEPAVAVAPATPSDLAASSPQASSPAPIELPRRALPAEEPVAWMPRAFAALNAEDPVMAGRVILDLLPALGAELGRDGFIDFAIDEVGAFRLVAHMKSGSVLPWRAGMAPKADAAIAGSALALAPFAIGGAPRRKPAGVESTGKRRVLKALLRARREPVSLAELQTARAVPGLGGMLGLLAAGIEPEWTAGHNVVVGFESPGVGAWSVTARAGERPTVTDGYESPDAVITVAAEGVIALFTGAAPPASAVPMVTGDPEAANLVLGWLDRVQRTA
ncbi:MAG TPA: hypothetical protein VNT22_10465 [Baekduia sp.]|nr:hypothetical protein [Baekduia sp.]